MVSRVWNIGTFQSKNFKMVHVNNQMTTSDFILKVAKIFNVRKELICVTYEFPLNDGSEVVQVETGGTRQSSWTSRRIHLPRWNGGNSTGQGNGPGPWHFLRALTWNVLFSSSSSLNVEGQWPHGSCAHLLTERSGFDPWQGTLCSVLRQDT